MQGRRIVDETVLHLSTTKPPTRSGKATTSSGTHPTIDSLFDPDLGHLKFPPAEVRSKLDKRPPLLSSNQAEEDGYVGGGEVEGGGGGGSHPPVKSESSSLLVEDSQPDLGPPNRSVLLGLRQLTQDASPPNRSRVLAPQSLESNASPDTSVLVPSSLTPRSQRERALPDDSLISALFKGRKRGLEEVEKEGEAGPSTTALSQKRQCLEEAGEGRSTGTVDKAGGAGIFSGLCTTRSKMKDTGVDLTEPASSKPESSFSKENSSHSISKPHGGTLTPTTPTPAGVLHSEFRGASSEEEGMDASRSPLQPSGGLDTHSTRPGHSASQGFKTPKKRKTSSGGDSTLFLSARRRKKSSREDPTGDAPPPTLGTQLPTDTQTTVNTGTLTQSTVKTNMTSPFTSLVTPLGTMRGGRRTKTQTTDAVDAGRVEDLWTNDDEGTRGEGENPLGGNGSQWGSMNGHSMYQPVCTGDGFILPREKPKLKVILSS